MPMGGICSRRQPHRHDVHLRLMPRSSAGTRGTRRPFFKLRVHLNPLLLHVHVLPHGFAPAENAKLVR